MWALAVGASWAQPAGSGKDRVVLVVGDSLSAEYGLPRGTGWVALLEQKLTQEKMAARVVNASISGDTTSGGRSRLPALLAQHQPAVVVIELGGNDALRGLPLQLTVDMQVPPNYGADYGRRFAASFGEVAQANKAAVVPFMLKGVADGPDALRLFQADRIHPTQQAHPIILATIWPELRKLIK